MSDTAPKQKTRSEILQEIRESDKVWFVKNNTKSHISSSFSEPPLSLGPAGKGGDVSILPKAVVDEPGFQHMWRAGKITVTDDPSVEEEMVESMALAKERRKVEYSKLVGGAEVEEPSSNKDLIEKKCLVTGERVYQTQVEVKNMVPPLSPIYKDRAHEFVANVSQDEKGNEVVTFSRVTVEK